MQTQLQVLLRSLGQGGEAPARLLEWGTDQGHRAVVGLCGCDVVQFAITSSPADVVVPESARAAGARALIAVNTGINR